MVHHNELQDIQELQSVNQATSENPGNSLPINLTRNFSSNGGISVECRWSTYLHISETPDYHLHHLASSMCYFTRAPNGAFRSRLPKRVINMMPVGV